MGNFLTPCVKHVPYVRAAEELCGVLAVVVEDARLKVAFSEIRPLRKAKELGYHRILDELQLVLKRMRYLDHLRLYCFLVLRQQCPLVILRRNVALKCPDSPRLPRRLVAIPQQRLFVFHLQKLLVMRPTQQTARFWTQ